MCKWYCTSEGPACDLACLHCGARYCSACLHGEYGKMESLVKCANCGKKPRTKGVKQRGGWQQTKSIDPILGGDRHRISHNALHVKHQGTVQETASKRFHQSLREDGAARNAGDAQRIAAEKASGVYYPTNHAGK